MSIIHDALKKVQAKNIPARPAPMPVITPEDARRSLTVLMAAALTVAVIVIFAILFKFASATNEHARPAAQSAIVVPSGSMAKEIPQPLHEGLDVEGVMMMGEKMIALINGDIYEEGQTVNGRIINKITLDNITVLIPETAEPIVLPIKRESRE